METRQAKLTHTFAINAVLASSVIIGLITVLFVSFITYKRYLEKRMEVDALTGAANRSYLQRSYQRLKRRASAVCVVMVDLDHFKQINDQYGHVAGDVVLKEAAKVLTTIVRPNDVVCRWGGEEFVLLIQNMSADNCLSLIERARKQLAEHTVDFEGTQIHFTASFGVSTGSPQEQLSKHLANADVALYESKKSGRNRATVYKS